jgi:hypothetical protein
MRVIWERNLCMRRKLFGSGSPDWYDLGNLESGSRRVIDIQDEVERLLRELTKALPLSAPATPALMANLREQSSTANITPDGKVTKVIYAGDEGGVICNLAFDEEDKEEVFLVSITHLAFDRRLPVARKIAAYQKHCIKRLRRDGSTDAPAAYHQRQVVIAAPDPVQYTNE